MKKMTFLLILPLTFALANCGKKVTVNDSAKKTAPTAEVISEINSLAGKTYRVTQALGGDYNVNDLFKFASNKNLRIDDQNGALQYYGAIEITSTGELAGSFKTKFYPSEERVFFLRDITQFGGKTALYFEYYNKGTDTSTEYYDGYVILVAN